jgi:fatty acid-binding protein DegV
MNLCILTNTTAIFSPASASSGRLIRVMPIGMSVEKDPCLPGPEEFQSVFTDLEREYKSILVLTASEQIIPLTNTALKAAQSHGGTSKISILDTQQLGPGLGLLAQIAARKAAAGAGLAEVEEHLRSIIPYLFTIIFPEKLPVFEHGNLLPQGNDPANLPIFSLEEGQLSVYKKVRTQRHLLEIMQEFLGEFEKPQHLAYFHGKNISLHARPLREESSGLFPGIHFHEIELNQTLTTLFGDHTVGLTVLEKPGESSLLA